MTHPVHQALWTKNGKVYAVADPNATSPIDDGLATTADGYDNNYRRIIVANGSLPGPEIIVYEGQLLKIRVINDLFSETTTIHWHGLHQRGTPWMDGLGFITQCPILPRTEFTYEFYVHQTGTYWYHSHVGTQRARGLFGALIIRDKTELSPPKEHILTITDWNSYWDTDIDSLKFISGSYINRTRLPSPKSIDGIIFTNRLITSGLINGKGRYYYDPAEHNEAPLTVFKVEPNEEYRFRIINTGAQFPFQISIDEHILKVVALDGFDVTPDFVDAIIIHPGERYDVVIYTNATVQRNYWIRAQTLESNYDHKVEAILRYTNAPDQDPSSHKRNCTATDRCLVINCPFTYFPENNYTDCKQLDELRSANNDDPAPNANTREFEEHFLNFGFQGVPPFYSPPSINGKVFTVPGVSALTQPHELQNTCGTASGCGEGKFCFCMHSLTLDFNKTIQMVLTNYGGFPEHHPIHMHGYSFYVLKMGYPHFNTSTGAYMNRNKDINCGDTDNGNGDVAFCNGATWRNTSWLGGNIPGIKLENAPRKDTITIPVGGYVVIRFVSDNPGVWGLHCHIDGHGMNGGMAMLLNDSYSRHPPPPRGFPKCGSFIPLAHQPQPTTQKPTNAPTYINERTMNVEDGKIYLF